VTSGGGKVKGRRSAGFWIVVARICNSLSTDVSI